MPCQAKSEVLQFLHLETVQMVRDAEGLLYSIGYRGRLDTTGDDARIDLTMPNAVSVNVSVGDVLLYRTDPAPQVVACKGWDEFNEKFDII